MTSRFLLQIVGVALTALVGVCVLPHDTHIRYRITEIGSPSKPPWIYERIHFDPTPIDVAFFGSSHTLNAVDSVIVSEGLSERLGRTVHAANLSVVWIGRDMHLILLRELLEARKPELVVLEVRDLEARNSHRGAYMLADPGELISAPIIVNPKYFTNLARLPLRQSDLWLRTQFPSLYGESYEFRSDRYYGSHLNVTTEWNGVKRTRVKPREELLANQTANRKMFAGRYDRSRPWKNWIDFNADHANTRSFVETARAAGVKVCFLYLPDYGSDEEPVAADFYDSLAPTIKPNLSLLYESDAWVNNGHLNAVGAIEVSSSLPEKLSVFFEDAS